MPPDYGPEPLAPLLSLVVQVLGIAAGGVALALLVRRPVRVPGIGQAVAAAAAVVLLAVFATSAWESSRELDRLRGDHADLSKTQAREQCAADRGVDPNLVRWLAERIPARERFYLAMPDELVRINGHLCASMLLLPRQRVDDPGRARYLVLWGAAPLAVRGELTRPGNRVETFTRDHHLVTRP